ncbi:PPOX class F420-dependent oxidoreductase [Phototrophicus methaneseepsis]|uniref:PPOX class F420-dependent oxidoreductase n=2 Tax=Phototrophicus methaneseepsis TaxID=2710758 RepID=A0A7S8EDU2_9CHLR|nr:PPOX class F420-dependent oxidoreductase [Phototrophicus methaneseepsis]
MTPEEYRQFLLGNEGQARTGKIASVRDDGRPHVSPVWFDLDGDDVIFTTWHESVKASNLTNNGRVALCVDDERPPFAYVIVEGVANIEHEPGKAKLLHWATQIARRYMGEELAEAYGKRNAVDGEWLIRIVPDKVIAKKGLADS